MKKASAAFGTGSRVKADSGKQLELGKVIKSGGAGSVYLLPSEPELVAKIYHAGMDLALYERKIQAMLLLTPNLPDLIEGGTRITQIAWPQALLRDSSGRFRGFSMPRLHLDDTIELEYVLQERQARAAGLPVGLGARMTLAANVSALVAELHRQKHYVVDLKPVNIRFYRHSLHLAMLDCDGFSIHSEKERFPAPQYTADYLAPEFHQKSMLVGAEENQDRFALAVIIFQLLNFGIHPFSGRPIGNNVPTDVPARIAGRYYAYGLQAHASMQPNPSSGHEQFPQELRYLFDRAFGGKGKLRPAAGEWAKVLAPFALKSSGRLVICARNNEHQHFAGKKCAACARAALISRAASAPKSAPSARRAPAQAKRQTSPPPQPVPTSLPATKINWWVMIPLLVVGGVLALPVFLLQSLDKWLANHVPRWHPHIQLAALMTAIVSPMLFLGYLFFFRVIPDQHQAPDKPVAHASTKQAEASKSAYPPSVAARLKPIAPDNIDALLKAAQEGNGAELDQRLAELAKQAGRRDSDNVGEAVDEFIEYRKAIAQNPETEHPQRGIFDGTDYMMTGSMEYRMATRPTMKLPDAQKDIDRYLERAVAAAPHDSWVLSEVGFARLIDFGNLTNHLPYEQVRGGWETTRKTYYSAIAADPNDYSHWFGLGFVCAAMVDETPCAESAFAIGNFLMRKNQAAKARQQDAGNGWERREFSYSRLEFTEFFFTGKRKARLTALKERGIVLAEKLRETSIPPTGQTHPGQPIGK
jgi:eukaryotic-like serine/threonine-protein kinase